MALQATPTRWWATHKRNITTWESYHRFPIIRFDEDVGDMNYRYDGQTDPRIHIESCIEAWQHRSVNKWVHIFVHTLDTTPRNWYTEAELHKHPENWSLLTNGFRIIFEFESEYPEIDDALEVIKIKVFEDGPLPLDNQLDWVA